MRGEGGIESNRMHNETRQHGGQLCEHARGGRTPSSHLVALVDLLLRVAAASTFARASIAWPRARSRTMGGGGIGAPFARLLANLIVMGSGVLGRAFMEAYKQALQNGGKAAAGAAAAGGKAAVDPFAAEARAILNIKPKASAEEVREAAERLAAMNDPAKGGSEYLRAKIHNARDALLKEEAPPKPPSDDANAAPKDEQPKA